MKIKAILLTSLIIFGLTACTPNAQNENTNTTTAITENGSQATTAIETGVTEGTTKVAPPGNVKDVYQNIENAIYESLNSTSSKCIGWGIGKGADGKGRPLDAIHANEQYKDYNAVFIKGEYEKTVYLTFDEGYENGYTGKILDILKEKGTPAVFFVTYDYCKNEPELVKRMISEGHMVGNHSYTHPSFPECTTEKMIDEVMQLHTYVKENFNYDMTLFRFPKGEFSEQSLSVLQKLGYTSVFWSFAHVDWQPDNQPTSNATFDKITKATHNGAIYLLHAVSKANTECLSDVIDYWQKEGYTVGKM